MTAPLLDPGFLQRLEQLQLLIKSPVMGRHHGERRTRRRGQGLEFADHRTYAAGDDLRRVDWDAYARLERLFLKLFLAEREATACLLLDQSASMDWGTPPKYRLARQLAGALGYVALAGYDRVAAALLSDRVDEYLAPLHGRAAARRLWNWLEQAPPPAGPGHLARACRNLGHYRPGAGAALLISDCLTDPAELQEAVTYLRLAHLEVTVIQVLAPAELDPVLSGDLRLLDREGGVPREVSVTPALLAEYRRRLADHQAALARAAGSRGAAFLSVPSNVALDDLLIRSLRQVGLVG